MRIYNRARLLTWLQDVEFSVYGLLYQAGRTGWGTAGMGGNGQFNRLSRARRRRRPRRAVARPPDRGPGPRAAAARGGLARRQELRAEVEQQGLPGCAGCSASARAGRRATCRRWAYPRRYAGARARGGSARAGRLPADAALAGAGGGRPVAAARPRGPRRGRLLGRRPAGGSSASSTCWASAASILGCIAARRAQRRPAGPPRPAAGARCTRSTRGCSGRCSLRSTLRQLTERARLGQDRARAGELRSRASTFSPPHDAAGVGEAVAQVERGGASRGRLSSW